MIQQRGITVFDKNRTPFVKCVTAPTKTRQSGLTSRARKRRSRGVSEMAEAYPQGEPAPAAFLGEPPTEHGQRG